MYRLILLVIITIMINGCGSGSSTNQNSNNINTNKVGYFIDSPVSGVEYVCGSLVRTVSLTIMIRVLLYLS